MDLTCQFTRRNIDDTILFECLRTDYDEVAVGHGDTVRLCPVHRSWQGALSAYSASENPA